MCSFIFTVNIYCFIIIIFLSARIGGKILGVKGGPKITYCKEKSNISFKCKVSVLCVVI